MIIMIIIRSYSDLCIKCIKRIKILSLYHSKLFCL